MSDIHVGQGHAHDPHAYRDQGFPGRPHGGFIEERLSKLEYNMDQVNQLFGSAQNSFIKCLACADTLPPVIQGHMQLPLCQPCLDNLGRITHAKKGWLFQ